jgi:glutaredoxin-like YruB-family protein
MQPTITIYSSPSCAYCHQAKEYFKEKGLEYTEKDITTDPKAMQFVVEKVGQAVTPIITLDDDIVVGFDRPQIEEILDKFHAADSTKAA